MNLLDDWQAILKRAWSMRLMLVVCLLNGCEAAMPLLNSETIEIWRPFLTPGQLALLNVTISGLAMYFRLVPQKGLSR
jgi:hypothetical protein